MVIVATVAKKHVITQEEVQEAVYVRHNEYTALPREASEKREKEIYQEELKRLIDRELLIATMYGMLAENGTSADDVLRDAYRMADERFSAIRSVNGLTSDEQFRACLAMQGLTLPVFRRAVARQLMADQFTLSLFNEMGPEIEPKDVRDYYDKHPEEFHVEDRVRYLDLFICFDHYPTAEAARKKAQKDLIAAGFGADFVSMVKVEEKGPPGRQNWDGIGTTRADVPPILAPTVWSMKPGETSGLIESPTGYHIVKVLERTHVGTMPFDQEVRTACENNVRQQSADNFYKDLMSTIRASQKVHVFDPPLDVSRNEPNGRKRPVRSHEDAVIDISSWLKPVVMGVRSLRVHQ